MFEDNKLDYDSVMDQFNNHQILPLLEDQFVFRINGEFMRWKCAAPLIMSQLLFGKLPKSHIQEKIKDEVAPKQEAHSGGWSIKNFFSRSVFLTLCC